MPPFGELPGSWAGLHGSSVRLHDGAPYGFKVSRGFMALGSPPRPQCEVTLLWVSIHSSKMSFYSSWATLTVPRRICCPLNLGKNVLSRYLFKNLSPDLHSEQKHESRSHYGSKRLLIRNAATKHTNFFPQGHHSTAGS